MLCCVLLCLAFCAGCKSECKSLCETQVRCQETMPGGHEPDQQLELCRTMCETMRADPERAATMERVLSCRDKSCDELAQCVREASETTSGAAVKSASTP